MEHGKAEGIDERTAKDRFSSEEKRALDRMQNDIYQEVRHAAEAHRQVCTMHDLGSPFVQQIVIEIAKKCVWRQLSTGPSSSLLLLNLLFF